MQAGAWTGTITNTAIDHVAEMLDPELPTANDLIIHMDLSTCSVACRDILYVCVERQEQDGFVCLMDTTILLIVIIAAVLTGILIPLICVTCCLWNRFCGLFDDHETQGLMNSDLRQDWDTCHSSGEYAPQISCIKNESGECLAGDDPSSKLLNESIGSFY